MISDRDAKLRALVDSWRDCIGTWQHAADELEAVLDETRPVGEPYFLDFRDTSGNLVSTDIIGSGMNFTRAVHSRAAVVTLYKSGSESS